MKRIGLITVAIGICLSIVLPLGVLAAKAPASKPVDLLPVTKIKDTPLLVPQWRIIPPRAGYTNDCLSICFVDAKNGWVGAGGGVLWHTTDGGANWNITALDSAGDIQAMKFIGRSKGWLSSYGIRYTSDGINWTLQPAVNVTDIDFVNETIGWAAFGHVFQTRNGGTTWTAQNDGIDLSLYKIDFVNENNGCGIGTNVIKYTSNGGQTWLTSSGVPISESGSEIVLKGIKFIGNNGWVVGSIGTSGLILHSVDGGRTWTTQVSRTFNSLLAVDFANASYGLAVGNNGTILYTIDGGTHWTAQPSGTTQNLSAVDFIDALHAWAVGTGGTILKYSLE